MVIDIIMAGIIMAGIIIIMDADIAMDIIIIQGIDTIMDIDIEQKLDNMDIIEVKHNIQIDNNINAITMQQTHKEHILKKVEREIIHKTEVLTTLQEQEIVVKQEHTIREVIQAGDKRAMYLRHGIGIVLNKKQQ